MIINHNMNALNAHRNMTINNTQSGKSMEKLSSGLRINRAGDDAAGLAISEKMRGQIRGLDQASRNAQDGISMIQTAEGALNETHSILQRMRELAVQAGNDTNTKSDRSEIQKEINQLSSEINRIGNTTEFNNQKLLDGSKANEGVKTETAGKAEGTAKAVSVTTITAGETTTPTAGEYSFELSSKPQNLTIDGEDLEGVTADNFAEKLAATTTAKDNYSATVDGNKVTLTQKTGKESATAPAITAATPAVAGEYTVEVGKHDITIDGETFAFDMSLEAEDSFSSVEGLRDAVNANATLNAKYTASVDGDGKLKLTQIAGEESATAPVVTGYKDSSVALQIGANENQSMSLSIADMRSEALGLTSKDLANGFNGTMDVTNGTNDSGVEYSLDVTDAKSAGNAVTKIQSAIDLVSAERSKLGAYQNRLEHTVNNLGTSSENLTSAESRVRDVDMAKEMMAFSKNNILNQAAQAMLSQANQQPQNVLQLLR